ncbi:hypothetical protein [Poseidonocella sedimentorum]|uniref:Uncharacterized protein n=1 Tax=Poseidonocella sedimentorum TaxID=871652 RepID=A0A1I6D2R1_9RHOB|nr:hypothetical protein [Poseidonocella sedimentorum]SFQ99623.1 hypothetical protein SAMN04515673_1025 [Poseidonocella sedimentorum]
MVAIGLMPLAGCMEGMPAGGSGGAAAIPAGPTEYMVINGRMGFETCRQAGGLIISDPGNAMVACDPTVKAPIVVETEDL